MPGLLTRTNAALTDACLMLETIANGGSYNAADYHAKLTALRVAQQEAKAALDASAARKAAYEAQAANVADEEDAPDHP